MHPPASSTGEQQTELREKRERKLFRLQYNDDIHFMLNELKNYVASSVTAIIDITKLEKEMTKEGRMNFWTLTLTMQWSEFNLISAVKTE